MVKYWFICLFIWLEVKVRDKLLQIYQIEKYRDVTHVFIRVFYYGSTGMNWCVITRWESGGGGGMGIVCSKRLIEENSFVSASSVNIYYYKSVLINTFNLQYGFFFFGKIRKWKWKKIEMGRIQHFEEKIINKYNQYGFLKLLPFLQYGLNGVISFLLFFFNFVYTVKL